MENIDELVAEIEEVGNSGFDEVESIDAQQMENDDYLGYQIAITGEFYNLPDILDVIRDNSVFVAADGHIGINSHRDGEGCLLIFVTDFMNVEGHLTDEEYFAELRGA